MASPRNYGGVLTASLAGVALLTLTGVAVIAFPSESTAVRAPAERQVEPQEVGMLLRLCGITPEHLAAAGVNTLGCEAMFNTGTVYCLQDDRLHHLQLAHAELNRAKERAIRPNSRTLSDGQNPLTVEQAQIAVDNLTNAGFEFVTSQLNPAEKLMLARIRSNAHWNLPAPYLVVDRTEREWIALRGALSNKRYLESTGETLPARDAQIIAAAEQSALVSQAMQDHASRLEGLKTAWASRESP